MELLLTNRRKIVVNVAHVILYFSSTAPALPSDDLRSPDAACVAATPLSFDLPCSCLLILVSLVGLAKFSQKKFCHLLPHFVLKKGAGLSDCGCAAG